MFIKEILVLRDDLSMHGLRDVVEAVKDGLKRAGISRFALSEEASCLILESPVNDDVLIAAVFEGEGNYYVIKLTLASMLAESGINCLSIQYSPRGLFIISDDLNEVRELVSVKFRSLIELKKALTK